MTLRDLQKDDIARVRELVESSMTTSYALSPQQIEVICDETFSSDRLAAALAKSDVYIRVAVSDEGIEKPTIVGFVEAEVMDKWGEIRWLFVDPEHRGRGIGTKMFESISELLRGVGVNQIRARVLEASAEGSQFLEQFGLRRADRQRTEFAGESLVEIVYTDQLFESDQVADHESVTDTNGSKSADKSPTVYIDESDERSGTEASFFLAYSDEEHAEQLGFYCDNCGSVETMVDTMARIECQECGNTFAPRSDAEYDDSYL